MPQRLSLAIIGCGAVAEFVASQLARDDSIHIAAIISRGPSNERAGKLCADGNVVVESVDALPECVQLIADCAGHSGLIEHGPLALEAGIDVISISTGALADSQLALRLEEAAKCGGSKLKLLAGAIGGIDVIGAGDVGELTSVTYVGRKPALSWAGSPAEEAYDLNSLTGAVTHFKGTAREAALRYPKNANVAATIALAGLGLDHTQVELIADPFATKNSHEVVASGSFGDMTLKIEGHPLPSNPKSSALAAMSMVREIRRRTHYIQF